MSATLPFILPNYSDTNPAAPSGRQNQKWQKGPAYPDPDGSGNTVEDLSSHGPNTGGVDARTTTSETIGLASRGKLVTLSNAGAIAATLDSTVPNDFFCAVSVIGAGAATFTPSSGTIDGGASLILVAGRSCFLFFDGANWRSEALAPLPFTNGTLGAIIDGGGSVPTTGSKRYRRVPYDCTITGWTMLADQSGSGQITVKKSSGFSGFPTTASIVASAPPAISSAQKATSTTLTGWTLGLSKGDVLEFNLDSVTNFTWISLDLDVTRSD